MTRLGLMIVPEGSTLRTYVRGYYREVVYFMHQPQSLSIKYLFLFLYAYGLVKAILAYQEEFRTVYIRKCLRLSQIKRSAAYPITEDQWYKYQEMLRLTQLR